MSAEIPFTNNQQRPRQRPTNLYCVSKQQTKNNKITNSLSVNNITTTSNNSIEKSTLSSKSLTPSPNNITTKIPMSKFTSLTPSPGMLRRSTSLRLRGDRLFYTQSNGHHYVNNNSGYISRCDSGSSYFRPNTLSGNGESKGSVNTGPCSLRPTITERSPPGHQKASRTPLTSRKNLGITIKSPVKDNIQESPIRHRSLSLSLSTQTTSPHTPPVSPDRGFDQDDEDDLDSLHSYSSVASTASCDHAYVARNGTTFSGRKMKYVVHCSSHAGQTGDEYLTPTQRAQRQIKRLKSLLQQAKLELEQKDSDIFRLTKEVVELRLYKASLNSPDEKSNSSSDAAVTVCENTPSSPPVPGLLDMQSSCADSGHFEDLVNASPSHRDKAVGTDQEIENRDLERKKLIEYYENKLQELSRIHGNETQELKRQHNDRVEALLRTLSEVNERYCQLVPDYETAKERIRELEKQLDDVSTQLKESEENKRKMYLKVYGNKDMVDSSEASTSTNVKRVSVADLLHQLQVTQTELENIKDVCQSADQHASSAQTLLSAKEAVSLWVLGARKAMYRRLVEARGSKTDLDPEVTLQFLKSAIYYFLTDKENHRGHLRAIESILGFTNVEIDNIHKANTL